MVIQLSKLTVHRLRWALPCPFSCYCQFISGQDILSIFLQTASKCYLYSFFLRRRKVSAGENQSPTLYVIVVHYPSVTSLRHAEPVEA